MKIFFFDKIIKGLNLFIIMGFVFKITKLIVFMKQNSDDNCEANLHDFYEVINIYNDKFHGICIF